MAGPSAWEVAAAGLVRTDTVTLRDKQRWPEGDWRTWLLLAGRRFGKTFTAAYHLARRGQDEPNMRIAVVAPTFASARDVCVEGDAGLLHFLPPGRVRAWNRSLGELRLDNGTLYRVLSADEPDRIRGWGFHLAWFDELASVRDRDAWDQLQYALSAGASPRNVVTTTPRPTPLIRELAGRTDGSVVLTRGATSENAANLSPDVIRELHDRYGGTRMGRQELEAEILDDVEGALWTAQMIAADRWPDNADVPDLHRVCVAVDPPGGATEAGIVAAGITSSCPCGNGAPQPHGFVLDDASTSGSPGVWGATAVELFKATNADRLIAERNFGGDMVRHVLEGVDRGLSVELVNASRGKQRRAEPVVTLYEKHRIHHVGHMPKLEDELTTWVPDESDWSPNRLDALVWALSYLLVGRVHEQRVTMANVAGARWRR